MCVCLGVWGRSEGKRVILHRNNSLVSGVDYFYFLPCVGSRRGREDDSWLAAGDGTASHIILVAGRFHFKPWIFAGVQCRPAPTRLHPPSRPLFSLVVLCFLDREHRCHWPNVWVTQTRQSSRPGFITLPCAQQPIFPLLLAQADQDSTHHEQYPV